MDTTHSSGITIEEQQNDKLLKNSNKEADKNCTTSLEYEIDDIPPWYIILCYAFQQITATISGPLTTVYLVSQATCLYNYGGAVVETKLLSGTLCAMGVASFIQTTFGVRLPILQGIAVPYLTPVIAMVKTKQWMCEDVTSVATFQNGSQSNITVESNWTVPHHEPWLQKINEINGCLMCAALIQIALGSTGLVGLLLNFIGPLTIAPTITFIGLSLAESLMKGVEQSWILSVFTIFQVILYSVILGRVAVPCITWSKQSGITKTSVKLFKLFPFLFAMMLSWLLSHILTITSVFPSDPAEKGYFARSDSKTHLLINAPWFYVPYPGQWGWPTVTSTGIFVGFICAALASTLESVGDYYATARVCQLAVPPKHAINRGIMAEGFFSIMCGAFGITVPTTSYSAVIGFIGITGVCCRIIWQVMSVMLILLGVFGKAAAFLSCLPQPIIASSGICALAMTTAYGLSIYRYVALSSRNLLIIGMTLMFATGMPGWVASNPTVINTGIKSLDQCVMVICGTSIIIGGLTACILDNILPGSRKERGLLELTADHTEEVKDDNMYNIPIITKYFYKISFFKYLPFLPCYDEKCKQITLCKKESEFI